MLLGHIDNKKTEERIIELLHQKESTGPSLLAQIQDKSNKLPKESFYRIMRKLINEEVINKQNKIYQLNRHWLQRIYRFSKKHIETNQGIDANNILSFVEGDKISYKFKNPNLMGIYWAHTYDMIFDRHDPKIPILIHHPHEWLIHTRVESETFFLNRFGEDKKLAFFSIGGDTNLDKRFQKDWSNKFIQVGLGIDYGIKKTEYINVLGDFIFKVSVSKRFSEEVDKFFRENKEINSGNIEQLQKLCNRSDTTKMVFIRSKKEADKWRAKFKRYFYTPRNSR